MLTLRYFDKKKKMKHELFVSDDVMENLLANEHLAIRDNGKYNISFVYS